MSVEWFELDSGKRAIVFDPDEVDIVGALSRLGIEPKRGLTRVVEKFDRSLNGVNVNVNGRPFGVADGASFEYTHPTFRDTICHYGLPLIEDSGHADIDLTGFRINVDMTSFGS